jgi:hypothetical protein
MLLSKLLMVRRAQRRSPCSVSRLHVSTGCEKTRTRDLSPAESRLETTRRKGLDANLKVRSTRAISSTRAIRSARPNRPNGFFRSTFGRNTAVGAGTLAFLSVTCTAADSAPRLSNGGQWGGFALGFILAILIATFSRTRVKAAEVELISLRELADHREYERNVAQQELVKRLEEERELAKEKMQFESQLSE